MINFLQINAEWMCAIAIAFFTAMQWWITRAQYKHELRQKRFELAHEMDNACIIYQFDRETIQKVVDWFNRNTSRFMYLLKEKDLKYYDIFFSLLKELYNKPISFDEGIKLYRKCLSRLDVALLNADYGIRKLKRVKKKKEQVFTWDKIINS